MKCKIFYAIALLVLFLTSCSKDQISIEEPSENVSLDIPDFDKMSETEIEAFFTSPEMLAPGPDDGNVDEALLHAPLVEDGLTESTANEQETIWITGNNNKRAANVSVTFNPGTSGDFWTVQQKTSSGWQSVYFGTASSSGVVLPYFGNETECIYQYEWRARMYSTGCNEFEITFSKTGTGVLDVDEYDVSGTTWAYFRTSTEDYSGGANEVCIQQNGCSGSFTQC